MSATALILALSGAFVHAAWNLALAGEPDVHAATAVAVVAGVVLLAPVALADWRLEAEAWPYVAASAALELLYLALLATAYARAAAGFVYPTARGAAPVFVLLIGVLALGQDVSGVAAAGVAAVAAGIVLVRGPSGPRGAADLALALAIGGCIAGYTLVDQEGVGHASTPAYLLMVFVFAGAGYVAGAWRARGGAALRGAVSRADGPRRRGVLRRLRAHARGAEGGAGRRGGGGARDERRHRRRLAGAERARARDRVARRRRRGGRVRRRADQRRRRRMIRSAIWRASGTPAAITAAA